MVTFYIRAILSIFLSMALALLAVPIPQATITAYFAPPGLPSESYAVVTTLPSSEVLLYGQRTAAGGSTFYDIVDANPTEIAVIEVDGSGKFVQAVDCVKIRSNSIACGGFVNDLSTTQVYEHTGTFFSTILTAAGTSAVPTTLPTSFQAALSSGLSELLSIADTVTAFATVTALPGWASR
ncbi:hypothetical protein EMMF5_000712 [Cystobasidiomycetes sp. EMM_F5]